jgi:SPASM domain peptide maturase of grasp-with-spasm system
MSISLEQIGGFCAHLYADCIPVRGVVRSAIYDLTRKDIIMLPTEYFDMLEYLLSDKMHILFDELESEEEKEYLMDFIQFLDDHEVLLFSEDPASFPKIEEAWDTPSVIQNAIIDIDEIRHDFNKIFNELDELGCQYVEIRSFSNLLNLEEVHNILTVARNKSIEGIELILKYDRDKPVEQYAALAEEHAILYSLTLHSSVKDETVRIDYGCDEESAEYIAKEIRLTSQKIDSHAHCGLITLKQLCTPTVPLFFENKLYNGCLNRKVSIDANGEIKNCPSMSASFGNIAETSIRTAIGNEAFQEKGKITKDQISVCRDCEFRYACTDCRAYTEQPANPYSKPLKCGYNPYTCEWEEWSASPLKKAAIAYYKL